MSERSRDEASFRNDLEQRLIWHAKLRNPKLVQAAAMRRQSLNLADAAEDSTPARWADKNASGLHLRFLG